MSATPRPWECELAGPSDIYGPGDDVETVAYISSEGCRADNARLIVRAVNAFDALLAVAKAGHVNHGLNGTARIPAHSCLVCDALDALDAAHPDWREWTP